MTFKEFLTINENSPDCKKVAGNTVFEPETVSFDEFVELYHKAYWTGLNPSDDVVDFKRKFKVDLDPSTI